MYVYYLNVNSILRKTKIKHGKQKTETIRFVDKSIIILTV